MGIQNTLPPENSDSGESIISFHRSHAEILEMLLDSKPLAEIFDRIALLIEDHAPVKAWCVIALADGPDLNVVAAPNIPPEVIDGLRNLKMLCSTQGSCGRAISTRKTVVIQNVREDPKLVGFHELSRDTGIQATWTVPVFDKDDRIIAIITSFYHEPHSPHPAEIDRAEDLRHLIALAIEKSSDASNSGKASLDSNPSQPPAVMPSGISMWSEANIWWNEGFTKLFGFSGDESGPSLEEWVTRIHR